MKMIYPVAIEQMTNGYIVQVACKRFVFESSKSLLMELSDYMQDPGGTEKRWAEKCGFDLLEPITVQAPGDPRDSIRDAMSRGEQGPAVAVGLRSNTAMNEPFRPLNRPGE